MGCRYLRVALKLELYLLSLGGSGYVDSGFRRKDGWDDGIPARNSGMTHVPKPAGGRC